MLSKLLIGMKPIAGEQENRSTPVGQGELNLAVEAARAQERRVERVGAVRGHDHLHVRVLLETVHLVEQLEQNALHLAVRCTHNVTQ